MSDALELMPALLTVWLTGSTLILGSACLSLFLVRQPLWRQRIAEMGIGCCLFWMILSLLPLPRPVTDTIWSMGALGVRHQDAQPLRSNSTGRQVDPISHQPEDSYLSGDSGGIPALIIDSGPSVSIGESPTSGPQTEHTVAGSLMRRHVSLVLYGIGFAVGWMWLGLARLGVWRILRSRVATPQWIASLYDSLPKQYSSRLIVSRGTLRPFSYGLRTPIIVLPNSICLPEREAALKHVLLHEQAHVDRRDAWGHLVLNLALPFLCLHPCYWVLQRELVFCRELLADDWAVQHSSRITYAQDLLQLVRDMPESWTVAIGVLGAFHFRFRHSFTRRMNMLLDRDRPLLARLNRPRSILLVASSLLLCVGLGLVVRLPAEEPQNTAGDLNALLSDREDLPDAPAVDATGGETSSSNDFAPANLQFDVPRQVAGFDASKHPIRGCVITAQRDVTLGAPINGQIAELQVKDGATVAKGDALCQFDNDQLLGELEIAKAKYVASMNTARDDLDVRYQVARVEAATSELDTALDANEKVPGTVADSEIARRRADLEAAKIGVDQAKRDQGNAKLAAKVALAEFEAAERRFSQHQIVAPVDGVVVRLFCSPGDAFKLGDPICRIVSFESLTVEGLADAEFYNPADLQDTAVTVEVRLARGERFKKQARIGFVSPIVEGSNALRFKAEVKNEQRDGHWLLLPGMPAIVRLGEGVPRPMNTTSAVDVEIHLPHLPSDDSAKVSSEEIESLQELVDAYQQTHEHIRALFEQGVKGAEAEMEARYALCVARARLARATGKVDEAVKQMKMAVVAAEAWVRAAQTRHQSGRATVGRVLNAQAMRAEAKLMLSRLQKMQSP